MAKDKLDKITDRDIDFSKWYTDVVKNSKLIDYGPVKGTMIFKPYGFAIWENIQKYFDAEFKKVGVQNVYFPLLIPASLFNREKEHIEGFAPELATVTKVGDKILEEELYIRPTSEVLIAENFAKEVKSYRDLPLKYNQWVNVMRWEKTTRPFLRSSEFLWQEGHTIHSTENEARKFTKEILEIYKKIASEVLLLPIIAGKKSEYEKFAGAQETYTIESLMYDGQSLQAGTSHFFGNNFSKAFDIKFQGVDQKENFAFSTSWGVSTRLIGAIIMSHSDNFGLVLPSKIAPIQVEIIKIKNSPEINSLASKIKSNLEKKYSVFIDDSDKSFGYKISESEIKGIPIRIEIGPRDLDKNLLVISRRDLRNKVEVNIDDVEKYVDTQIKEYDKNIFQNALRNRELRTFKAETLDEYIKIIENKQGYVLVPFCGEPTCEEKVKQKTSTNSRCIPEDVEQTKGICFNCKKESNIRIYFGRAY